MVVLIWGTDAHTHGLRTNISHFQQQLSHWRRYYAEQTPFFSALMGGCVAAEFESMEPEISQRFSVNRRKNCERNINQM